MEWIPIKYIYIYIYIYIHILKGFSFCLCLSNFSFSICCRLSKITASCTNNSAKFIFPLSLEFIDLEWPELFDFELLEIQWHIWMKLLNISYPYLSPAKKNVISLWSWKPFIYFMKPFITIVGLVFFSHLPLAVD